MMTETYENIRPDKGFRFMAEKVSHNPLIIAVSHLFTHYRKCPFSLTVSDANRHIRSRGTTCTGNVSRYEVNSGVSEKSIDTKQHPTQVFGFCRKVYGMFVPMDFLQFEVAKGKTRFCRSLSTKGHTT